jgi:N4-gp56 family major capsid protein
MTIDTLPASLRPLIQDKFLDHGFEIGLQSRLGFRAIADREPIAVGIGETLTKTRVGLLVPSTTPRDPATNQALDNGLAPQDWAIEQYSVRLDSYGGTLDLNRETSLVAIGPLFLENAKKLGLQALQSLDRLARNALYGAYLGGNSVVTATLGVAGPSLQVDSVAGFEMVAANGSMIPVSAANPMTVTVGAGTYMVIGTTRDAANSSSLAAFGGASGTLTCSTALAVAYGAIGNPVVSAVGPVILRPNGRATTSLLVDGDRLTAKLVLAAVAQLRDNNVPDIDGLYNCYLDNATLLDLFQDPDFKHLYEGAYGSDTYATGQVPCLLGVRFTTTTEAPRQTLAGRSVRRAIVCGQGALIEGDYAALGTSDLDPRRSLRHWVDGVCLVVRPSLDRFQEIIAQSWKWRGGFCVPTDLTADPTIIDAPYAI